MLKDESSLNDDLSNIFTLPNDWTIALYSIEYCLTKHAISKEKNPEKKAGKEDWLHNWEYLIRDRFKILDKVEDSQLVENFIIIKDDNDLQNYLKELISNTNVKSYSYLTLIEAILFRPFFKLESDSDEGGNNQFKYKYRLDKKYLGIFVRAMNLDESLIMKFKKRFDRALMSISGRAHQIAITGIMSAIIIGITAGFAAPAIAVSFAAPGLTGAAAISSGLATLGGGAIAVGGYGMVGGITVLVSSGAILGIVGGTAVGVAAGYSPNLSLFLASKLEVFFSEVLLPILNDPEIAKKILNQQSAFIATLNYKLNELYYDKDSNKKLKVLKKAIKFLNKSLKNNRKLLKNY